MKIERMVRRIEFDNGNFRIRYGHVVILYVTPAWMTVPTSKVVAHDVVDRMGSRLRIEDANPWNTARIVTEYGVIDQVGIHRSVDRDSMPVVGNNDIVDNVVVVPLAIEFGDALRSAIGEREIGIRLADADIAIDRNVVKNDAIRKIECLDDVLVIAVVNVKEIGEPIASNCDIACTYLHAIISNVVDSVSLDEPVITTLTNSPSDILDIVVENCRAYAADRYSGA